MDKLKQYIQQHADELDTDEPNDAMWNHIAQQLTPLQPVKAKVIGIKTIVYTALAAACCIGLMIVGNVLLDAPATTKPNQVAAVAIPSKNKPLPINNTETVKGEPVDNHHPSIAQTNNASVNPAKNNLEKKYTTTAKASLVKHQPNQSSAEQADFNKSLSHLEADFNQIVNLQKARINTTPILAESPGYYADFKMALAHAEMDEKLVKKEIAKSGLTTELLDRLITIYQQKLTVLKQLQNEINKTNQHFKQNKPAAEPAKTYFLNI